MWRKVLDQALPELRDGCAAYNQALNSRMEDPLVRGRLDAWDASAIAVLPTDPATPLRCLDVWYLDDSYIRASVIDGDLWLAAADACGAWAGLERSITKSSYRAAPRDGVIPPYTAVSCDIQDWSEPIKFLGVSLSNPGEQFAKKTQEVAALHKRLRGLDDPAVELLLIRECAEVNRVNHLLRAVGPVLPSTPAAGSSDPTDGMLAPGLESTALQDFDAVMRNAVASVTRCEITADAAEQASWGVKAGGLGLRPATTTALPAHTASMVETQPFVEWLCTQSTRAGLPCTDARTSHQARRDRVVNILTHADNGGLSEALRSEVRKAEGECAGRLDPEGPAGAAAACSCSARHLYRRLRPCPHSRRR
jgi:hypothetical protein